MAVWTSLAILGKPNKMRISVTSLRGFSALAAVIAIAGCSASTDGSRGGVLSALTTDAGAPDEFKVVTNRPLEVPEDLGTLAVPTQGGANRADLTPRADALAALGGNGRAAPVSSDRALLAAAGTAQADPDIRARLFSENQRYQEENKGLLLERWFRRDAESRVYSDFILDADRELARLRARGIWTPAAPPPAP